jgi:hypothetical protein
MTTVIELTALGESLLQQLKDISARNTIPETFFQNLEQFDGLLAEVVNTKSTNAEELRQVHELNAKVLSEMGKFKTQLLAANSHFLRQKGGLNKYLEILGQR